jgi:hypothetical protein
VKSKNKSRDHLREDNVRKVVYAYMTPNSGDDINKPRFREVKSLKVYINE